MLPMRQGERIAQQSAAHVSFRDQCVHLVYTPTAPVNQDAPQGVDAFGQPVALDVFGQPTMTYQDDATYPCGFSLRNTMRETQTGDALVTVAQAQFRLPRTAPIQSEDRLRLIVRDGEALAIPVEYKVVSDPVRGPTALVIKVERVKASQ